MLPYPGLIKCGWIVQKRSAELHSISITANRFISRRFSKGFGLAGVRMEFRVYAAFGYVTKVVSNGSRKRETPCHTSQLVAALPRCAVSRCIVDFQSAAYSISQ